VRVRMRFLSLVTVVALAPAPVLLAQAPAAAPLPAEAAANPVVWSAKLLYDRTSKNMTAAADEMPADKYSYHPTPDQWTFAKVVSTLPNRMEGCAGPSQAHLRRHR